MLDGRLRAVAASVAVFALVGAAPAGRVTLQLDQVAVADVVTMLFRDVLGRPYVIAPEVAADRRLVSVKIDCDAGSARAEVARYLAVLGLTVRTVGNADVIGTRVTPPGSFGSGVYSSGTGDGVAAGSSAVSAPVAPAPRRALAAFVYQPRYRDVAYLVDLLRALFPDGQFGVASTTPPAALGGETGGSGAASVPTIPQVADSLVFGGTPVEIERLKGLLVQLDVPQPELSVRATVYEVETQRSRASGLQIVGSVLKGKLGVGSLASSTPFDSFLRLSVGGVDAVFSALSSDSRFKVVTSPSLRARSGSVAVLNSGQQVPVLGAVSYQGNSGTPVQSVEYRDSGVIFRVRPVVRRDVIDVDVSQEVSNFVRTTTGVNTSPTLTRRALSSALSLRSGDVVVLGGLTEDSDTRARSGILPGILGTKSRDATKREIILVLQLALVPMQRAAPPPAAVGEDGGTDRLRSGVPSL
jgi:general secretion pathway protein D